MASTKPLRLLFGPHRRIVTAIATTVITLALGLGLGLGLKHHRHHNASQASQSTQSLPFLTPQTSNNFTVGSIVDQSPQDRKYNFTISLANGAPDGVNKTMLVVNGTSLCPCRHCSSAVWCCYDVPRPFWLLCVPGSRPRRQFGALHCFGSIERPRSRSSVIVRLRPVKGADRGRCSTAFLPGGNHPPSCNSPFLDIINAEHQLLGMYPGPTIEVNQGDRLIVKVQNNLPNATSIHWHGLVRGKTSLDSLSILTNGLSFKMAQIGMMARQE